MKDDGIVRTADFSECRTWRYTLKRVWDESKPVALFILLNPSTADEVNDDNTNTRGIRYAQAWGYGGVTFCNLFAVRTPYPKVMKAAVDPVGPENNRWIMSEAEKPGPIILAWGTHGVHRNRDKDVVKLLNDLGHMPECMGKTKDGHPKHILYLKKDLVPVPY